MKTAPVRKIGVTVDKDGSSGLTGDREIYSIIFLFD